MKSVNVILTVVLVSAAGVGFAHTGVKNAAVKARMDAMSEIGAQTKVLGMMVKGEVAFDASRAREAAGRIAEGADAAPELFRAEENDPLSEAKQDIWSDFEGFVAKSNQLAEAAGQASQGIETIEDLRIALKSIGGACQACHKEYRK